MTVGYSLLAPPTPDAPLAGRCPATLFAATPAAFRFENNDHIALLGRNEHPLVIRMTRLPATLSPRHGPPQESSYANEGLAFGCRVLGGTDAFFCGVFATAASHAFSTSIRANKSRMVT